MAAESVGSSGLVEDFVGGLDERFGVCWVEVLAEVALDAGDEGRPECVHLGDARLGEHHVDPSSIGSGVLSRRHCCFDRLGGRRACLSSVALASS